MDRRDVLTWQRLDRWGASLYLLGGTLLIGYAVLNGLAAVTELRYENLETVLGPGGFAVGFLGALGLYPQLSDRGSKLALCGAVSVVLGFVGFALITFSGLLNIVGLRVTDSLAVLLLLSATGMIPGYVSLGIATVRHGNVNPRLGLVLVLPAIIFASMLAQPFIYTALGMFSETTMAWSNFLISSGQAVAHVAIGITLLSEGSTEIYETKTDSSIVSY